MFDYLRQDDRPNGMKYFTSLVISLVVHTTVLSAIVLVPMIYFHALNTDELLMFVIATPKMPLPPPVPTPPQVNNTVASARPRTINIDRYQAPGSIPTGVIDCPDEDPAPIHLGTLLDGFGNGPLGITNNKPSIDIAAFAPPRVLEPPKAPDIRTPVRVGTIQEAKLIHKVEPAYPKIALAAHVSGTVIMELVIDEEGNVTNVKVLKGHPLLDDATVQAVKQWKYLPTIQNGEPIPVLGTVTVFFRIR
jgi:periplasmic protein TonB